MCVLVLLLASILVPCPMQHILSTIYPPPVKILMKVHKPGHPSFSVRDFIDLGAKRIHFMQGGKWSPMQAVAYIQDSISCSRFVVNFNLMRVVKPNLQ